MKLSFDQKYYYGILLSGGLDSAILLYLLVKHNKGIKIQPFTIPKKDGAYLYADPIIDFFNRKFNFNIPGTVKAGSPDVHHSQQNESAVKEVFQKHQVQLITAFEKYDIILLAVAHDFFKALDYAALKTSPDAIVYDTKAFLDRSIVTARL